MQALRLGLHEVGSSSFKNKFAAVSQDVWNLILRQLAGEALGEAFKSPQAERAEEEEAGEEEEATELHDDWVLAQLAEQSWLSSRLAQAGWERLNLTPLPEALWLRAQNHSVEKMRRPERGAAAAAARNPPADQQGGTQRRRLRL